MIKQFLIKQKKIAKGIYFTYLKPRGEKYNDKEFWDKSIYTNGISDRQTISPEQSTISAKYHYCSVELLILKHFIKQNVDINNSTLLDIGSGSGHWIDFYKSLGFNKIIGVDVSKSSIDYLKNKYPNESGISLYHDKAIELLNKLDKQVNIVNAIGVMFHIVDDYEWKETIEKIATLIPKNGLFIVGGHFGLINGVNVQRDKNNHINKRLRSKAVWKYTLKKAGFTKLKFYNNNAYLWIKDTLPENNILIATK